MAIITRTLRRSAAAAALAASLAAAAPAAHAYPVESVFDNLDSSDDGTDSIGEYGILAQSFTSPAEALAFGSAVLLLTNDTTANLGGSIQVSLLADSGSDTPGATLDSLGSLDDSAVGTSEAEYVFNPVTEYILTPDTQYWIEVTGPTNDTLEWGWSLDQSALGVAHQYAYDPYDGSNATATGWGSYQMDVEVPEPASLALIASALAGLAMARRRRSR